MDTLLWSISILLLLANAFFFLAWLPLPSARAIWSDVGRRRRLGESTNIRGAYHRHAPLGLRFLGLAPDAFQVVALKAFAHRLKHLDQRIGNAALEVHRVQLAADVSCL